MRSRQALPVADVLWGWRIGTDVIWEYLALVGQGRPPSRQEFLGRHPEIAPVLREALDALDFLHSAAGGLGRTVGASGPEVSPAATLGDFDIRRG